jgi:TRAP-type mannitol/chloroaromatic compound transport system substrate-binding protein
MDRRSFLATTGLVTTGALGGTAVLGYSAPASAAPAGSGPTAIIAVAQRGTDLLANDAIRRLTARIAVLSGGQLRLGLAAADLASDGASAQAYFGSGLEHVANAPGLAFFGGMPGRRALSAPALKAWLVAGGGQILWDDYLADYGLKPLLVGLTGAGGGLWSDHLLHERNNLNGLNIAAHGLAQSVARALGAVTTDAAAVSGIEATSALAAVAGRLPDRFTHVVREGLVPAGSSLMLAFDRAVWDAFSPQGRAIIEAAAAEELRLVEAEAFAHQQIAWSTAEARGIAIEETSPSFARMIDAATADIISDAAARSPVVARIRASYDAFSKLVGPDAIVA